MSLSLSDWGGALVALPVPRENRRSVKLGGQDGEAPRELGEGETKGSGLFVGLPT